MGDKARAVQVAPAVAQSVLKALNEGLAVATGCTEPVAIAYAGAMARSHTSGEVQSIRLEASANIIKNAFVVGIPGTDLTGLENAVALGVATANPERELNLLNDVEEEKVETAKAWVAGGLVKLLRADNPNKLYIRATVVTGSDEVSAEIIGTHTNVSSIVKNGEEIYNGNCNQTPDLQEHAGPKFDFGLREIYEVCSTVDLDELDIVKKAIELNGAIAREGMTNDYGLRVGKTIQCSSHKNILGNDIANYAMMMTAAGSDARMAGANLSVMSNSGSGNQGISATVPVLSVWEKIDGKNEEKLVRAVAMSNLVGIYIKSKFGVLSALCGAVVAGAGAAFAIVYLMDGKFAQMELAVQNVLGNVAGMLCDGAKASCALKISSCVNAAMQAVMLAMNNLCIGSNEGIVECATEYTIDNFAALGKEGADEMDKMVLDMIINKRKEI